MVTGNKQIEHTYKKLKEGIFIFLIFSIGAMALAFFLKNF